MQINNYVYYNNTNIFITCFYVVAALPHPIEDHEVPTNLCTNKGIT